MDARQLFELEMEVRSSVSNLKISIENLPSYKLQKESLEYAIKELQNELENLKK